ncbi:MAG TPA: solute carrier family 23 protein, partial [Bacillota bacterium]|nr:solute carrier family 23 protein [Bacillota bacterium]
MENFFKLRESGTSFSKELVAGATTFFAMVYIIFVNPAILSKTGIPHDAVFVATILATVIGTLVMALFANVPY